MSVSAQAQTWTEIDALIDTSAAIAGTLDESYLRIGGASSLVGTSIISDNMLTETYQYTSNGETITSQTTMQSTQTGQYNISVMDVMDASYTVSVQEYLDGQYTQAGNDFSAAIDTYIDAASIFARAVKLNELATTAETTGNLSDARAVQDYINANNILLTNTDIAAFNNSIGDVEDAVRLYSAVAILKEDSTTVASLQSEADAAGRDYLYANDAAFSNSNNLVWGFTGPDGETAYDFTRTVDMSAYVLTNRLQLRSAGSDTTFYQSGPTQNACFFSSDENCTP